MVGLSTFDGIESRSCAKASSELLEVKSSGRRASLGWKVEDGSCIGIVGACIEEYHRNLAP